MQWSKWEIVLTVCNVHLTQEVTLFTQSPHEHTVCYTCTHTHRTQCHSRSTGISTLELNCLIFSEEEGVDNDPLSMIQALL